MCRGEAGPQWCCEHMATKPAEMAGGTREEAGVAWGQRGWRADSGGGVGTAPAPSAGGRGARWDEGPVRVVGVSPPKGVTPLRLCLSLIPLYFVLSRGTRLVVFAFQSFGSEGRFLRPVSPGLFRVPECHPLVAFGLCVSVTVTYGRGWEKVLRKVSQGADHTSQCCLVLERE